MTKICKHCKGEFDFEGDFCCRGCETAFNVIEQLGLKKFYEYRKSEKINLDINIQQTINDFTNLVSAENALNRAEFAVSGVKCPSCIWLIENALKKFPEINFARVNLSTNKLIIEWQGEKSNINQYADIVSRMGYRLAPYEHKEIYREIEEEKKSLLKKIAVSGFAIVAVMMFSDGLWEDTRQNIGHATHDFLHWILILVGLPAIIYSGSYFFSSAIKSLKSGYSNMDVPIASSILVIVLLSIYQAITGDENIYLDSAVMLIFSLLCGRYLELQARTKAKASALEMVDFVSGYASLVIENGTKIVSVKDLKEGDMVLVATGDKVPADCIITKGSSEFDTSIITGETAPKSVNMGDAVYAGMINLGQAVECIITREIKNSEVTKILNLLDEAEKSKTGYSLLAEKATKLYIPVVYGAAIITLFLWYFIFNSSLEKALIYSASVLIITCPCALGLAIPAVNILAFGKLFKSGIMLKKAETLENLAGIKTIIFDKTGTLTEGKFTIKNLADFSDEELKIAASLAARSKHPISIAIANVYQKPLYNIEVKEIAGYGLEAEFKNRKIKLGKPEWCGDIDKISEKSVCINIDSVKKYFLLEDKIRIDAKTVISTLKDKGFKNIILSGDSNANVEKIAEELAIKEYKSSLLPEDKYNFIKNLKHSGEKILMVGDGLNDAPSIALADVSVSPGSAIGITQNSASVVFKGDKLKPVIAIITIGNYAVMLIKQNIYLSFLYNFFAIPYAMSGYMTPVWAAIAMSVSSLAVITNSLRLNRLKI